VNKIEKRVLTRIIAGMSEYLQACNCILAGGETAEMPGAVLDGMVELSGFAIGAAEKKDVLDPSEIKKGDVLIGWPSAGFHANGFSLVRRILAKENIKLSKKDAAQLLTPTLLYHEQVWGLRKAKIKPAAMAHITGGGLVENLGRIFTKRGLGCHLKVPVWKNDIVQKVLRHADPQDAWDTFNMGIGWVAILDAKSAKKALKVGQGAVVLGEMDKSGKVTCELAG
jgi:phosphoribosylformylglycinamidine cyclo-ligase